MPSSSTNREKIGRPGPLKECRFGISTLVFQVRGTIGIFERP